MVPKKKRYQVKSKTLIERSLEILARRDYSSKELACRLVAEGYVESEVALTLTRLKDQGYVDDQRFAENYVEYCNRYRPRGNLLLELELQKKGIDEGTIKGVLNEEARERELAIGIMESKKKSWPVNPQKKHHHALFRHLYSRGFCLESLADLIEDL